MDSTAKKFLSYSDMWGLVGDKIFHGVATSGGGPRGSYPVPVLRQGQAQIAFMIYNYALIGANQNPIWPPTKVAWFDPIEGKLIAEISVTPAYFGQKDSADKILGNSLMTVSPSIYLNFRKRLPVLFDTLLPVWVANPSLSRHIDLQNQAREFLRMFDQVCEPPLRPYYYALGRDWFGWLRAVAQ